VQARDSDPRTEADNPSIVLGGLVLNLANLISETGAFALYPLFP
jgi:hypothetical protein